MTQLESARQGVITPEMARVAIRENTTPEFIRDHVAAACAGIAAIAASRRLHRDG